MALLSNLSIVLGFLGLIVALVIYLSIKRQPAGNDKMKDIASQIQIGAMA